MILIERQAEAGEQEAGLRLDQAASRLFSDFSRARIQRWITAGDLLLNGAPSRVREKVKVGDALTLRAQLEAEGEWQASPISLDILHEDESVLVVNKPVGLVVHPAAGHSDDTLLNGLLDYLPTQQTLPRAGIVHRLDRDTSGLLVVAKTLQAHAALVDAMQARLIKREYQALVQGKIISGGTIDAPIGRHPRQRQKMAVVHHGGKSAVTHYRVMQRFNAHTLLRVDLETGRTHQIRVHMASIAHPIVGDQTYGGRFKKPAGASEDLLSRLAAFNRQALHAWKLTLDHPISGEQMTWEAPLPADMNDLLECLVRDDD